MSRIVHIALVLIATSRVAVAQLVPAPTQPDPAPTQRGPAPAQPDPAPQPAPGEPAPLGELAPPGEPTSPDGAVDLDGDGVADGEAELMPDPGPLGPPVGSMIARPPAPPVGNSSFGVDGLFMMPVGEYSDGIEAGFGVLARFEYRVAPRIMATARAGALFHLLEDNSAAPGLDATIRMLLAYAGARYDFADNPRDSIFLVGEVGLNRVRIEVDFDDEAMSSTEYKPSFNLGAGFQYGHVTLRGSVFVTPKVGADDEDGGSTLVGLIGSIGLAFSAL